MDELRLWNVARTGAEIAAAAMQQLPGTETGLAFYWRFNDYADYLEQIFEDYDAILTPSTPGPAPAGLEATGSPVMNTIWTFCGTPAINLPILQNEAGLPIGVQLVGASNDDARLFRSARWLLDRLQDIPED